MADWDSMGRAVTQTRDRSFEKLDRAFQTLGLASDFLFKLQILGRVFRNLSQGFERLGRVFYNKQSVECFFIESL